MIIAVGQSKGKTAIRQASTDALLEQWGTRMWTFPEVLLSPGQTIPIYTRGGNLQKPLMLSKNQFAARVWEKFDAAESGQLVDHVSSRASTTSLFMLNAPPVSWQHSHEQNRARRHSTEVLVSSAHDGASSRRPGVRPDGLAEAAATDRQDRHPFPGVCQVGFSVPFKYTGLEWLTHHRLSLANDSDKLLERYMCTLPLSLDQPWYDMRDAYRSSLWDIEPYCQVAAICDDDTIVLDGARGASIRWKSFFRVGWFAGFSWKRWLAVKLMENMSVLLILMVVFFALRNIAGGVICLLLYIIMFLNTPTLIRTVYGGKFVGVQAALFGFEGYLNAPTVERAIFGGAFGRIGWSENGSPLARSFINEHGERVGMDPTKDPVVRMRVERAKQAKPGEMRVSAFRITES